MRKTKKPLALLLAFLLAASLAGGHLVTANAEEDVYQTTGAAEVSGSEPESAAESSAGTADDAAAVEETGEQDSVLSETEESSSVSEETSQGETEEASQEETEGTAASEAETAETAEAETDSQMPAQSFAETLDSGITVTVEAPDGALPDGSVLHAAWIGQSTEETDATAQVAAELDDAGVAYDGFVAMDIYFTAGEDGAEVEPAQPVSVRLELPEGMLPAETDLESLAVQHLAENDQGQVEAVETVADASDAAQGTVTADTEVQAEEENTASAVTAEFQVGSFSSFVITWTGYNQSNISKELTVTLIDTEGKELDVTGLEDERTNSAITIREYAPYVQNHTYLRAVLASDAQSAVQSGATQVSQLRLHRESVGGWFDRDYEYTWQYKNSGSWNNDWHDFDIEKQQIYLIYSQDTTGSAGDGGGDVDVDLPEPSISKTALRNEDGTYDLNLSVTGSVGSQSSTVNVDVLMIVDESNSMDTGNRIPYLKNAMRALVNTLEANEGVDARYSIVSFGTTGKEELEWTSMPDPYGNISWTEVGQAINRIDARGGDDGGTNYMAGFRTAQTLLNEANGDDRDAMTVVIFLSDGKPTYYYTSHDGDSRGGDGNEELGISSTGWLLTMEEADDFACDQFYSVGIGNAMSNYLNTNDAHGGLLNAVNARVSKYIEVQSDASDLTDQFEDIAGSMTDLFIENVTITDQLDLENVEPVLDGNGEPARLTVSVSDDQGQDVTETEVQAGRLVASYEGGVLKLDFDDSYGLKAGYTYTITLQIQPTKAAEEAYRESETYPDTPTGGVYTGTHTGETGFYSNTQATLTYYYTDNEEEAGEQSLEYPMPVVQVPEPTTGSLTIQKKVAWDSENEEGNADSALFTFTITGPAEAADSEEGYPIAGTGQKVQFELVSQDS